MYKTFKTSIMKVYVSKNSKTIMKAEFISESSILMSEIYFLQMENGYRKNLVNKKK